MLNFVRLLLAECKHRLSSKNPFSMICLLASIGIILFVVGCSISAANTQPKLPQAQILHVSTLASAANHEDYVVGETFKLGDLQYTINSVRTSDCNSNKAISPKEGNTYLLVDLTIENQGNAAAEVRSLVGFKLKDKQGRKPPFSIGAVLAVKSELDGTIMAGGKMTGELGYEVLKEPQTFNLIITPYPLSSESAVVKIPLEII